MTLDEAIQRENKIAEENQKILDTQIVFDDVSISELYCDDTEVIEEHLSNYRKCAEYHKQLADWLEELKFLKQWKSDIMDSFCKYDVSSFEELVANVRNKTIGDFVKEICKMIVQSENNGNYRFYAVEIKQAIADLAEQLKVGVSDGNG